MPAGVHACQGVVIAHSRGARSAIDHSTWQGAWQGARRAADDRQPMSASRADDSGGNDNASL